MPVGLGKTGTTSLAAAMNIWEITTFSIIRA